MHIFAALAEFGRWWWSVRVLVLRLRVLGVGWAAGPTVISSEKLAAARALRDAGELTMEEIASLLGVSQATLYRHLAVRESRRHSTTPRSAKGPSCAGCSLPSQPTRSGSEVGGRASASRRASSRLSEPQRLDRWISRGLLVDSLLKRIQLRYHRRPLIPWGRIRRERRERPCRAPTPATSRPAAASAARPAPTASSPPAAPRGPHAPPRLTHWIRPASTAGRTTPDPTPGGLAFNRRRWLSIHPAPTAVGRAGTTSRLRPAPLPVGTAARTGPTAERGNSRQRRNRWTARWYSGPSRALNGRRS
jgi:DNA-binding transcriptional ArsR family regulator